MTWLWIVLPVILAWIVSLYKIVHTSCSASKAPLFYGDDIQGRNVLLVVAHPDDESMFFAPTISHLVSSRHNLHILCMSTGNADQMGNARKEELYHACAILKVPLQQIKILDHPALQDGFGKVWDHNLLVKLIEEEVLAHDIKLIITFDNYGVSGHCNHRDVYIGVRKFLLGHRNIETLALVSNNIFRKYSGPIDIWLSFLCTIHSPVGQTYSLLNMQPRNSFLAMAQHKSQWVWFRKLFVCFSSYTYVNTLKKINY